MKVYFVATGVGVDKTPIPMPAGATTTLGRGPLLRITDDRVSRKQATVTVSADGLYVKVTCTGLNPCYLLPKGSKKPIRMENGQSGPIYNGDEFWLIGVHKFGIMQMPEAGDPTPPSRDPAWLKAQQPAARGGTGGGYYGDDGYGGDGYDDGYGDDDPYFDEPEANQAYQNYGYAPAPAVPERKHSRPGAGSRRSAGSGSGRRRPGSRDRPASGGGGSSRSRRRSGGSGGGAGVEQPRKPRRRRPAPPPPSNLGYQARPRAPSFDQEEAARRRAMKEQAERRREEERRRREEEERLRREEEERRIAAAKEAERKRLEELERQRQAEHQEAVDRARQALQSAIGTRNPIVIEEAIDAAADYEELDDDADQAEDFLDQLLKEVAETAIQKLEACVEGDDVWAFKEALDEVKALTAYGLSNDDLQYYDDTLATWKIQDKAIKEMEREYKKGPPGLNALNAAILKAEQVNRQVGGLDQHIEYYNKMVGELEDEKKRVSMRGALVAGISRNRAQVAMTGRFEDALETPEAQGKY